MEQKGNKEIKEETIKKLIISKENRIYYKNKLEETKERIKLYKEILNIKEKK